MSGSVLHFYSIINVLDQQLRAWYEIRFTLLGQNYVAPNVKKALELVSVCEHPNAV
jgi:hypothetical protein